ncbi:MAG TPA: YetF domain-containing protein [Bacteriovoracaceae bacterium]|nr:YetF domain-containing protein [Bacteriovoracaceae bacterium]
MSEAIQNALIDDEKSISGAYITVTTMMLLNVILNKISFHSKKAESIIQGKAKLLIKNGFIDKKVMQQETMTDEELLQALRHQGVLKVEDVGIAMIEPNGEITVVKKVDAGALQ